MALFSSVGAEHQISQLRDTVEQMRASLNSQATILSSRMFVTFPVFSGYECEDVREFVSNFTRAEKLNGWDEDKLALGLPLYLKGHASIWFKTLENPDCMKFDELSAAIISHFACGASEWRIRQALSQRRQLENEPVNDYSYSIRSYCVQLNLPRSEWMHYFVLGLKPEIREHVILQQPKTLEEAENFSKLKECVLSGRQKTQTCEVKEIADRIVKELSKTTGHNETQIGTLDTDIKADIKDLIRAEVEQSDAGLSDVKTNTGVLSSHSKTSFCERSKDEKTQVVKNAVVAENKLAFENSRNSVDVSDKSGNAVDLIESCESFTPIGASEANGKQEDGETDLLSRVIRNTVENGPTIEAARDTTKSCDDKCPLAFGDSNAVFHVTNNAIDGICFSFSPDSSIISVGIEGHEFPSLVDTGAAVTAVNVNVWNKYLKNTHSNLSSSNSEIVTTVNGCPLKLLGKALVKFVIHSEVFIFEAHVIEGLNYDIILGRDFLQKFSSKIDFDKAKIEFSQQEDPLPFHDIKEDVDDCSTMDTSFVCSVHADFSFIVPPESEIVVPGKLNCLPQRANATGLVSPRQTLPEKYSIFGASELVCVSDDGTIPIRMIMINPTAKPIKIYRRTRLGDFEEVDSSIGTFELNSMQHSNSSPSSTTDNSQRDYSDLPDLSDSALSDSDKVKFKDLFAKYRDVFAFSDDQLGRTSLVQHTIDTGDASPIKQRPYRTTPENKREIDRQVSDMLERGIIQESVSPWSSPVVLVKKKNGEMRFCVDFRRINKVTKKDSFPMPLVADTLDALSGTQYFTTLDLKSGYWQIELHPSAQEKSAFVTHNGLYEFLVMPFGLTNSGASFQRLMGHILRGLEYRFALIYIDDIIIFSKSVEEHLAHLEEVFRRLREANVKLNPKKCSFVKQRVEYLGHVVTPDGVQPNPEKVRVVRDFPVPKNLKELRAFMGLANYYRRFVRGFAHIASPLNALTKKGVKFGWTQSCADAFDKLKRALVSAPILAYPDFKKEFLLFVDASSTGIGFTLAQKQNGKEVVIAYNGRGLNRAEQNYSTTEREALALVEGIKKFQPYLFGRKFTVITDHSSLRWLMNVKDATGRLARWSLLLQQYDFEIVHRPGREHSNADSLSRRPYEANTHLGSLQKEDPQVTRTRELQRP
ncbi:hypothetical protein ACROYT_G017589 [Oculina patagonica]